MKAPAAQAYLNKEARKIYKEICDHLEGVDAVEPIDSYIISMASLYLELFERYADSEPIQTFKNGTSQVSPAFTIMKDAREGFIKLSAKLGMSAKDRELMIKFKKEKKQKDALDDLIS
jgi:P27 family predicted phage terminase small subunit